MYVKSLFLFLIIACMLSGIHELFWLHFAIKGYKFFAEEGETFFQYCCRELDSLTWRIRKKLHIDWYYNSKGFKVLTRLKGILLIVCAFALTFFMVLLRFTEFSAYLDMKL